MTDRPLAQDKAISRSPKPPSRKNIVRNIFILTLPSIFIFICLLELFTRAFLPVSDYPDTFFHPVLGNHFVPDQTGTYIKGKNEEINANFRINVQGWNSPHDYTEAKPDEIFRIAVIGDSFVEALQVDFDDSFPYLMENYLNQKSAKTAFQVYSFGHSGASLAHYSKVLAFIGKKYKPDLVIIKIIHNDFMESFEGYGRVDNWSLKDQGGTYLEIEPRPAKRLWMKRLFRNMALARYLIINQDIMVKIRFIKDIFYGDTRKYEANISAKKLDAFPKENIKNIVDYIFQQFAKEAKLNNTKLLLVVNATRYSFENRTGNKPLLAERLNKVSREAAKRQGIPFLDLTPSYKRTWTGKPQSFVWKSDGHLNANGHRLVAQTLSQRILKLLGLQAEREA